MWFKSGVSVNLATRMMSKVSESSTNIQLLKDQNQPLQIGFNSMLNRDINEIINIPDFLPADDIEISMNRDSLFATNPKLLRLEKQKASYEAEQIIAKKEGYPMIGLGVDYSIISKRDVPDLEMNGQDAIMPMVTLTLPIFRKKYKAYLWRNTYNSKK